MMVPPSYRPGVARAATRRRQQNRLWGNLWLVVVTFVRVIVSEVRKVHKEGRR